MLQLRKLDLSYNEDLVLGESEDEVINTGGLTEAHQLRLLGLRTAHGSVWTAADMQVVVNMQRVLSAGGRQPRIICHELPGDSTSELDVHTTYLDDWVN